MFHFNCFALWKQNTKRIGGSEQRRTDMQEPIDRTEQY